MWISADLPWGTRLFFPQPIVENFTVFHRLFWNPKCATFFHRNSFHNSQPLWKTLQAGIDIGSDVPDVILQGLVLLLQLQRLHI